MRQHFGLDKGADVEAHPVIQIGLPAERLSLELLPAHENVVRLLALENAGKLVLQDTRGLGARMVALPIYPIIQHRICDAFEIGVIEAMVMSDDGSRQAGRR
jgi:hypothetical protein